MKVSWTEASVEIKAALDKAGCGPGRTVLFIPQFIFSASCQQHDFYYNRGGGIFDKVEADLMFFAHMAKDIANSEASFGKKCLYMLAAKLYFLWVMTFGFFVFTWGRYRTQDEILKTLQKIYG